MSQQYVFLGGDPGVSGCISLIRLSSAALEPAPRLKGERPWARWAPLPDVWLGGTAFKADLYRIRHEGEPQVLWSELHKALSECQPPHDGSPLSAYALLEKVHGIGQKGQKEPGEGEGPKRFKGSTSSEAKLTRNAGFMEMAVIAASIPWKHMTPKMWMAEMGVKTETNAKGDTVKLGHLEVARRYPALKFAQTEADSILLATLCCQRVTSGHW